MSIYYLIYSILRFVSVAEWNIAAKRSSAFKILIAILEPTMIQIVKLFCRGRSEIILFELKMEQSTGCNKLLEFIMQTHQHSMWSNQYKVLDHKYICQAFQEWKYRYENMQQACQDPRASELKHKACKRSRISLYYPICVFIGGVGQIK